MRLDTAYRARVPLTRRITRRKGWWVVRASSPAVSKLLIERCLIRCRIKCTYPSYSDGVFILPGGRRFLLTAPLDLARRIAQTEDELIKSSDGSDFTMRASALPAVLEAIVANRHAISAIQPESIHDTVVFLRRTAPRHLLLFSGR